MPDQALHRASLGSGQSVTQFRMNYEHDILYTHGKGSMDIGIWRFDPTLEGFIKHHNNSTSAQPTIGFDLMPRWAVDLKRHEVDRGVRVVNDHTFQVVGFSLKNRTDTFQPELYGPFPGPTPSSSAERWAKGEDVAPNTMTFAESDFEAALSGADGASKVKLQSSAELKAENEDLKKQLAAA